MQIAEFPAIDSPPVSISPNSEHRGRGKSQAFDAPAPAPASGRWQTLRTALPLLTADICAALVATLAAYALTRAIWPGAELRWSGLALGVTLLVVVVNQLLGLYPGSGLSAVAEMRLTSRGALYAMTLFVIFALPALGTSAAMRMLVPLTWGLLLVLLPLGRLPVRAVFSRYRWWGQPALIVGNDTNASATYSFFHRNPRFGLRPLGYVGDAELGEGADSSLIRSSNGACLIVAVPRMSHYGMQTELHYYRSPQRLLLSHLSGASTIGGQASGFLDRLASAEPNAAGSSMRLVKRGIDVFAACVGGVLILPLVAAIAILIKLQSPGPVFFCQDRIGRNGSRFRVWKFRTMICDADKALAEYLAANPAAREEYARVHKLKDDPRITSIGHWLRKTSLDELPQLWNVLLGQMTLVGPRPIMPFESAKYGDRFKYYCAATPGMTGLWQVSGRNDTTYDERVYLDTLYVSSWSVWLDMYILVLTIKVVLFRQGAY